jgi:hypothetical protein
MRHEFTYPKVTEIRRLSLAVAPPPYRQGPASSQHLCAPPVVEQP